MKIAFNPSTVAALITPPNNKDITFDLRGRNIFARGVKFCGTDTWRDIKINNVSIGSNILDLQNGSNTTLTNTNGVVTINSTWRPVVDNLTSDSTTSSLSANQGRVLKALIDGKSDSEHNHDGRYLRLNGSDTMQGNLYLHSHGTSYIGRGSGDKSGADFTEANIVIRSWWGISFKSYDDIVRTYIDTRTGNIGTKGVLNAVGAVIQGRVYNGGDDEGIIVKPSPNGYAGLILGAHNGERSVFYFTKGNPFWRYNNGSTNLDILHPKKSGTIALTSDIPSSLKNPYSLTTFGVVYDGSAAKVVGPSNFISLLEEGTSVVTDGTMFITSYASNSGFADTNAVNVPYKRKAIHLWEYVKVKTDSLYATKGHNHDERYVRAFGTSNDNIDSNWGQSFKTFDPIPSGTPPEKNPNISLLSIGENFNRRKLLAFIYNNDNIYYRRHTEDGFSNWRRIAFANEIPLSLKNPHALTISLNGTSLGPYDGSAAKSINITPSSIGAATSGHNHDDRYLKLTGGTMSGTICRNSGGATISGRDHAIIRLTYAPGGSSWNPIACVDTETGTWTLGHLSSGDSDTNFHFCFSTNADYNAGNNNGNYVTLRNKVGVIALLSEIPDKNSWNYDDRYLKLTGGTMNGNARIGHGSGNLYIGNSGNDGWLAVQDICSQDSIGDGKWSIRVNGTASFQSIKFPSNRCISQVESGSNSPLKGIKLPNLQSNGIGIFSRVGNGADEGGIVLSEDTCVIYNSFDAGWGLSVRDKDLTQTDISSDDTVAFGIRENYKLYSRGGFEKSGSDNSYVLLGGGGHKALSDFSISGHTHSSITIPVCSSLDENSDVFRIEYAGGSNSVATKPSGVDAFGVIRLRTAAGWYGLIMMSANTAPGIYYRNAEGLSSSVGWKKILDSSNFNSYSPKLDGTGASGTWHISITGNADTVDGYHASDLVKFYLSPMTSNAPADSAKNWFVNTMPSASAAIVYNVPGSEKTIIAGKSSGALGHMLQLNYDDTYLRILRYYSGSWKSTDWEKISAGYADSSGNTDLLDGYHASDLFTNLSNLGNNISITIGGTNKTLTVGYASTATLVSKSLKWTDATGTALSYNGGTEKSITSLNFPCNQIALNFRHPGDGYATKILYMTAGNEALVFAAQNSVTSFIFKSGANITNSNLWYDQVPTPTLQLKGLSAYINKLIANGSVPAFNFLVNGSSRFDGKLWQLYSTRTDPNATCIRDSAIACFGEYDDDAMWIGNNTNNGTWILVSFKGDEDRPSKNYLYNLSLLPLGGNVGIGTNSPTEKLTVNGWIGTNGIYTNRTGSSTDGGVSLYSNVDPMTYGIALRGTGTYGTHGYVTSASDWATYLTMNDSTTRGWIFRRGDTNVASIAGSGNMAIGLHLEFSNGAHISTNRSTDYHYEYTFNLGDNTKSIGMYSGPAGEAGGVVISPDGCLIYNSSDCGYNLQVRDKDLGSDLTNIATLTFGIELSGYCAWSRGGFKKNGSSDSYVLLGGGGHQTISSLSVNYANSAGNADTLDDTHLNGIFTAFGNNAHNITATIGGVTKSFLVNWATYSDKLDGYHASDLLTSVTNTNNGISVTVGGTTKSVSNISVNYAASAGSASSATQATNLTPENTPHYFRDPSNSTWRGGMYWGSAGSESMSFVVANSGTRFQFVGGSDIANWTSSTWQSVTPYLTIYSSGIVTSGSVTATNGFIKSNSSDSYVLLGGGGHKAESSLRVEYATSAGSADTALYLRSLGNLNCQTGRTLNYGDVYTYNTYDGNTGSPTTFTSVIGFGRGIAGTVEIAGGWDNTNLYWRSLRDCCEDWHSWRTVLDSSNYSEFINNYYWANVKISASSSTTTSPTVYTLTATRVCAGHNPGIDNSISCSNWFRSSGATGWYNTTYNGGWYMSDTSWIRAHNGVGIYTSGKVKASGFHHVNHDNDDAVLLAGGSYKTLNSIYGGDSNHPVFLGYLNLDHGSDGTVSSSFYCLGYSVPFTYTRGGNYCKISIPDTTHQTFYIKAATASVNYSGGGMDTWTGNHRGAGAWWLHCYAPSSNEVRVKGFHLKDTNNDSWWGGNPLWSENSGVNRITVCIFGYVTFR